jgi:signal peptidase I
VSAAKRSFLRETISVVVPALLVAVAVQAFVIKAFRIPSESMLPNLLVGDYLFVSKYSYGYSRYSLPFAPPLFSGRILAAEPRRGDVAVFRLPSDDSIDYIKRVIGLPGDRVQMIAGIVHINGQPITRERVGNFTFHEGAGEVHAARYREILPGGISFMTLDLTPSGPLDDTQIYRVPPGHFFMMGDNRDDSADSRVLDEVGYVPFENFIGRAEFIFFSVAGDAGAYEFWRWPWTVRADRLFTAVR